MRRAVVVVGAVLVALALTALASASSPSSANAHLKHVFVIVLENHSQTSVIDDPNAPFITSLAHAYGMADNYFGVTHPSEPNYVAMITGSNQGFNDDQPTRHFDVPNLVTSSRRAGIAGMRIWNRCPRSASRASSTPPTRRST